MSQPSPEPPRRKILVVEDEPTLADAVLARLNAAGFETAYAATGPAAIEAARAEKPDALVLDVMLPGFDGLEVCRRIQAEQPLPVLMLTARDAESDLLAGLGAGADDYLTKPFSMRELIARITALLRRVDLVRAQALKSNGNGDGPDPGLPLELGSPGHPLTVDRARRRVRADGAEVHLTPIEFDLLLSLARRPGQVVSRQALLAEVWDWADASGTRTVDSHVKALRKKIGAERIRTVHGVGYALETGPEAASP
ncbi:response regulator transcription factor [Actinospica sp. MGRD01-02]|uniref:Response regulator transcription factor n=1 Tax=Actinospica acidithermotolerans TaxID=2828514 RepID=A0A941IMR3_9ACTN|nr:response regulator transcription factor [Actinospica acidithermotolerans]MBR7831342.1 response regulator transcription factor [Actinospica acidithermotolerans]